MLYLAYVSVSVPTAIWLRQQHHPEEDISRGAGSNHTSHPAEGFGIRVQTSKGWVTPEPAFVAYEVQVNFFGPWCTYKQ